MDNSPIWLFDYDLTLYGSEEAEVLWSLDRNITKFVETHLGLSTSAADSLRRDYCARFGTTLGGLRALHGVQPHDYFDFIHAGESLQMPAADPRKRELLLSLPGECWVFTNARSDWAERGLESMGIRDCFQGILDIQSFQWDSKPNPQVYAQVESRVGAQGARLILLEDKAENLGPAHARGWRTVYVHPNADSSLFPCDVRIAHLLDLSPAHIAQLCTSP